MGRQLARAARRPKHPIAIVARSGYPLPGPAIAIAAGSAHSIAVTAGDGQAWTWGWNVFGQLGNGCAGRPLTRRSPCRHEQSASTSVDQVSAGAFHSFARTVDGHVWAWGYNNRRASRKRRDDPGGYGRPHAGAPRRHRLGRFPSTPAPFTRLPCGRTVKCGPGATINSVRAASTAESIGTYRPASSATSMRQPSLREANTRSSFRNRGPR